MAKIKTKGKLQLHLKREPSTMVSLRFPVWLYESMQECLQVCREESDNTVTLSDLVRDACYRIWYKGDK